MNIKEYELAERQIEQVRKSSLNNLAVEFAESRNLYNFGDILLGESKYIIIYESHRIYFRIGQNGLPTLVYTGTQLKKNLELRKDGAIATIWNVEKKLGVKND